MGTDEHRPDPPVAPAADDAAVLARVRAGDAGAFEQVVAEHEPRIRRLVFRLLGWDDDAVDDVVQEVFLAALRKLPRQFRGDAALATWLTTVTLNKCRSHRRWRVARWKWLRSLRDRRAQHEPAGPPADRRAAAADAVERVTAAMAQLGQRDREILVLRHLEEMELTDVAATLGVTKNAAEVRLHRARQRLKAILGDVGID